MMKKTIILGIVALAALYFPSQLSAQEHKRVEVTTIYNPEVQPATKIAAPTEISDSPVIEPEIEYGITPETWQIGLDSHLINPTKSSFWDFGRAKHFYTQLGAGYPLGSRATLHYATQNVRYGYFGAGVDHYGNFARKMSAEGSVLRSMADSFDMQNRVYVGGGVFSGCQMFEAGLEYNCNLFNNFATTTVMPNIENGQGESTIYRHSDLLVFHDVDLKMRYGDDFVNLSRLNFAVEAHGGYWAHNLPPSGCVIFCENELNAGGSVHLARKFGKNRIDLKGGYDMWMQLGGDYRNARFNIEASYARTFGFLGVDAGIGYMFDRVRMRERASHHIMPRVKLLFNTGLRAITPYIELNTSVSQNGIANLYNENPYLNLRYYIDDARVESKINMFDTMPNTRSYNLVAGFSGSDVTSRVEYRLYMGANFMHNQIIWHVATPGTFSVATGDNNRIFIGVELGYKPIGGLLIAGSFYAHADNTTSAYVVDDARIMADLKVEYQIKRWKFYVSGDFVGKRTWSGAIDEASGIAPIAFVAAPSVDLLAGIAFRTSKRVEIYADGYNLLNDDIYDYAYYYRNGAGFMAGVKIDF